MDHDSKWDGVVNRLRGTKSLRVVQSEIGSPVTDDDLEVIKLLNKTPPPPEIMQFFTSSNGVKLLWSGTLGGQAIQGSINILSLVQSTLRGAAREGGEPLEDILWNEEFEAHILTDLKRMAIFESIAGQSAYLTYFIDKADARLFLVEGDRIRQIVPDFETTIGLLKLYAGAGDLREHLTYNDWRERIGQDQMLQLVAAL
jgi:hypothetical protein